MALEQLQKLTNALMLRENNNPKTFETMLAKDFSGDRLRPRQSVVFDDGVNAAWEATVNEGVRLEGAVGLVTGISQLGADYAPIAPPQAAVKIFQIDVRGDSVTTRAIFESSGQTSSGILQQNAIWRCRWTRPLPNVTAPPTLESLDVERYEETRRNEKRTLFSDCTDTFLNNDELRRQLYFGQQYWRERISTQYFIEAEVYHGLALGDANSDGLDDVSVCCAGGQRNLLLIQNPDGSVRDAGSEAGVDWLDPSRSALFVDFDNDGDQDLAPTYSGECIPRLGLLTKSFRR